MFSIANTKNEVHIHTERHIEYVSLIGVLNNNETDFTCNNEALPGVLENMGRKV